MYDEVVSENVPDDFLSFLEEADERLATAAKTDAEETASPASIPAEDSTRKKA
jgi:hypothetical protein